MNITRNLAGSALRLQTYATAAYVPPASLEGVLRTAKVVPPKPKPESPTFYTGRANYYDQLIALESASKHTRTALRRLELLPLPKFARENLPPLYPVWRNKGDLAELMDANLTTSRYRRFLKELNQLNEYRRLAEVAGHMELAARIQGVLETFERDNKEAILARGRRKPVKFDEYGRSYTIGRRKESTARVWVIAVQPSPDEQSASPATNSSTPEEQSASPATNSSTPEEQSASPSSETTIPEASGKGTSSATSPALGIAGFTSGPLSLAPAPVKVLTTNILINNIPLPEYFPQVSDRERIVRPFRIAGLIGAFNVFALVRGGGSTGQSGAVTLGIAKALAAHVPDVEPLLRKAKMLKRDPRMVERKKTGRPKARKGYTWVKR